MKEKAENSRGRGKDELTKAYKSYADYAFTLMSELQIGSSDISVP